MRRYLPLPLLAGFALGSAVCAAPVGEGGADPLLKAFDNKQLIKDATRLVRTAMANSKGKVLIRPVVDSKPGEPTPKEQGARVYYYRFPLSTALTEQPLSYTEFGKRVLIGYVNAELRTAGSKQSGEQEFPEIYRRLKDKPNFMLDRNAATGWNTGADIAKAIYEGLLK